MNLFRTLITALCIMPFAAQAQIPNTGLIGHWPFTNNTNDVSSNSLHAMPYNVDKTAGKMGVANTAYRFDSLASYMSVAYSSLLNTTDLSICAVLKPEKLYTGLCQGNYIVTRGVAGASGSYIMHYYDNPYTDCNNADTNQYVLSGIAGDVFAPNDSFKSAIKVHTGSWYCMVLTYTASTLKVYINGVYVSGSTIASTAIGTSTDSLIFGKYFAAGTSYPYNLNGVLDDVALYNRVLTDSEINTYCSNAPKYRDTSTSVGSHIKSDELNIFPNPGKGIFNIEGSTTAAVTELVVYDMHGRVAYSTKVNAVNGRLRTQLDLSGLSTGNYILRLSNDTYVENRRLVIE